MYGEMTFSFKNGREPAFDRPMIKLNLKLTKKCIKFKTRIQSDTLSLFWPWILVPVFSGPIYCSVSLIRCQY